MGRYLRLSTFDEERMRAHPGVRRPVAPGPDDRGPSGDRAGRKEGPRRGARRPTMAPAAGRGAPGLWRACNWLMGAFFALAAFVQVSAPGRAAGGGRRDPGLRAPPQAPCGVDRAAGGVAGAGPVRGGLEPGLVIPEPALRLQLRQV